MFLSRPGEDLKEHLEAVALRMLRIHQSHRHLIRLSNLPEPRFFYYVGFSHDFGKFTTYFQEYLESGKPHVNNLHHHSLISAFFGAWLLLDRGFEEKDAFISFYVIKHHHGNLSGVVPGRLLDEKRFLLENQLKDLSRNRVAISRALGFSIDGFLMEMERTLNKEGSLWKALDRASYFVGKGDSLDNYLLTIYTFSLLIDSDKKLSAKASDIERLHLPHNLVDIYRQRVFSELRDDISIKRDRLYGDVMKRLNSMKEIPGLISVNAPTGLGKTLLTLSLALKIRHRKAFPSRIVYALPFTSIVDQTHRVVEDVLSTTIEDFKEKRHAYLLKHHHLSEISYVGKSEEKPLEEALLLVESWESEVIITTFVQVFQSIVSSRNSFLKKFHNMVGGIVILDEVQNIPPQYWVLTGSMLKALSEKFSMNFILSTATRPLIFSSGEYVEMVENFEDYLPSSRTRLIYVSDRMSAEDAFSRFMQRIEEHSNHLFVFNTIGSSREFYLYLKGNPPKGYKLFYLSANVVPAHRLKRIEEIRRGIEKGERLVVVSTQVVEAGVDLDFEKVWRDVGPLDSIIQVAGRCNRNFRRDTSPVHIFTLQSESGRLFASMVYGAVLPDVSSHLLVKYSPAEEMQYHSITQEYFREIMYGRGMMDRSIQVRDNLFRDMSSLRMEDVSRFRLIENIPGYVDVFVQVDERAKDIFERFKREVLEERDFIRRRLNYIRIRSDFRNYVISVPLGYVEGIPMEPFPHVPLDSLDIFYDLETGFRRQKGSSEEVEIW